MENLETSKKVKCLIEQLQDSVDSINTIIDTSVSRLQNEFNLNVERLKKYEERPSSCLFFLIINNFFSFGFCQKRYYKNAK